MENKDSLRAIQSGTLRCTCRDVSFLKSPFDIALYMKLFFSLKPRTVIEIGSHHGGWAILFAHLLTIYCVAAHVYSVVPDNQPIGFGPRIILHILDPGWLFNT